MALPLNISKGFITNHSTTHFHPQGNVTFSAESHEEMEEWVIQIQRFIYEGDGCSSEQVRRVSNTHVVE